MRKYGVKGGDTLRKYARATGESPCSRRENGVSRTARRKAESWSKVAWEVGDAHNVVRTGRQQKRFGAKGP
jgi:hypothetical protein